jgi:pimeloyl-ACP methyl ester carboxylesterase
MPYHVRPDGTRIHYHESGVGGRYFVFVHGFCGDLTLFRPQVARYSHQHRTISIDWRGHGQSDVGESPFTYTMLAEDVAGVLRERGVERAVLVGHSMGAGIVVEAATIIPEAVAAIVSVDGAITNAELNSWDELIDRLKSAGDHVEVMRDVLQKLANTDQKDVVEDVVNVPIPPRDVLVNLLRERPKNRLDESLAAYRGSLLLISAGRPLHKAVSEIAPQAMFGMTVGAGHFCQLEVPDQVNAMIDRFLSQINLIG